MYSKLRLISVYFISILLWPNVVARTQSRGALYKYGSRVHCKLQPNSYDCSGNGTSEARFYFDTKMNQCKTFEYSDCDFSYNNFYTLNYCYLQCRVAGPQRIGTNHTAEVFCQFQPDFGDCNSYFPMYYFDISLRSCKGFSYSGCGGNGNRFANARLCAAVCSSAISYPKSIFYQDKKK